MTQLQYLILKLFPSVSCPNDMVNIKSKRLWAEKKIKQHMQLNTQLVWETTEPDGSTCNKCQESIFSKMHMLQVKIDDEVITAKKYCEACYNILSDDKE